MITETTHMSTPTQHMCHWRHTHTHMHILFALVILLFLAILTHISYCSYLFTPPRSRTLVQTGATPGLLLSSPSLAAAPSASQHPLWSSPGLCRVQHRHGPLGAGAVPQLHDCLNHCAADVAAGESLSGLNHGATREEMNERGGGEGEMCVEGSQHGYSRTLLLIDSCSDTAFTSFRSFSVWSSPELKYSNKVKNHVIATNRWTNCQWKTSLGSVFVFGMFLECGMDFWQ